MGAGMLPLARELLQRGTSVVLAANSEPSINDITASELEGVAQQAAPLDRVIRRALQEGALTVVPSGNDLPVIDLREVAWCFCTLQLRHSAFTIEIIHVSNDHFMFVC